MVLPSAYCETKATTEVTTDLVFGIHEIPVTASICEPGSHRLEIERKTDFVCIAKRHILLLEPTKGSHLAPTLERK